MNRFCPKQECYPTPRLTWSSLSTWQPPEAPSASPCTGCAPSGPGPSPHGWSAGAGQWECCPAEGRSTASANKRWNGIEVSTGHVRDRHIFVSSSPALFDFTPHFPIWGDNSDSELQTMAMDLRGFSKPMETRMRITTNLNTQPSHTQTPVWDYCQQGALIVCKEW